VILNQVIDVGNPGILSFTPTANANGVPNASFGFKASDGLLDSTNYTMTINVIAETVSVANAAPEVSTGIILGDVLSSLNNNVQPLLNLLTNPHDIIVENPSGTSISDGGLDIYDTGNIL